MFELRLVLIFSLTAPVRVVFLEEAVFERIARIGLIIGIRFRWERYYVCTDGKDITHSIVPREGYVVGFHHLFHVLAILRDWEVL